MVHYCNTKQDLSKLTQSKLLNTISTDKYITLQILYIVLPCDNFSITDEQIQAQHDELNKNYIAYQTSVDYPSNTIHYPYETDMTDPKIVFQPYSSSITKQIQRLKVPTASSYTDITQVINEYKSQGYSLSSGVIHAFITTLGIVDNNQLLGQAEGIISIACMVDYGTVGSPENSGPSSNDGQGKTLIHEIGHCFGLIHPFSESSCDSALTELVHSTNPIGPKQILPNFTADVTGILTNISGFGIDNALDNRGRDFLRFCTGCAESATCQCNSTNGLNGDDTTSTPAYSCASRSELAQSSTVYETFMIFMDYADDSSKLGFPSHHTQTMRSVLLNNPGLFITAEIANPSDIPTFPILKTTLKFPVWAIIVIPIVLGIIIIVVTVVLVMRHKGLLKEHAQAPLMPHLA